MYNENIDRYIITALYKNFDTDLYMYTEKDTADQRSSSKPWIEVRYDGPDVKIRKPENIYKLLVDVFISCPKTQEIYSLEHLKGKVKAMFVCLKVYDDEGELLFVMDTQDELKVTDFGTIDNSRLGCSISAVYANS